MQQARNLYNARKRDKETLSGSLKGYLLASLERSQNKGWVRPVPAAAVTLADQVVSTIIGSKALVAGLVNPL